jgi:type IV pilus assembly protein PilB
MNALILRLKYSIDQKLVESIDKKLMGQYHFVPISIKDDFLFVAVSQNADKAQVTSILKEKFSQQIKFMLVHGDDFKELIAEYLPASEIEKHEEEAEDKSAENSEEHHGSGQKLGEMLVAQGVINQVDLMKALASSKRKNVPIGSTLFEMGLISLDQLKEVLHNQSGYNIVTADQLANQKNFVNILPEDFIKANSVIPVSSDGKTLTIGVVKPIDQDVIRAIIYMTGLNPKQLLMTHYEFRQAVNTFFSESKRQTDEIISQIKSETGDEEAVDDTQAQIKR